MYMLIKFKWSDDLLVVAETVDSTHFRIVKILKRPPLSSIRNEGRIHHYSKDVTRITFSHKNLNKVIERGMLEVL